MVTKSSWRLVAMEVVVVDVAMVTALLCGTSSVGGRTEDKTHQLKCSHHTASIEISTIL